MRFKSYPQEEQRVGREIHRLSNRIRRRMEIKHSNWHDMEITANNVRIICYLYDHQNQDIYQKDLEATFGITRSTASKVLRLMEQKGLILRLPVSQDARLKKLVLTDWAKELHHQMRQNADEMDQNLLAGFTPEEEKQLLSYLDRMLHNLD
ncbi:MAG: MarR family transcriptional regulator [Clostridia bacterium]|nr:MarR family transcriptional regulator [Clostridia bacterium]